MLYVNDDNEIQLTRGDTARLTVPITNLLTEDSYEIANSDILKMTVRKRETDESYVFQKKLTGSNSFHLAPADTAHLQFGKYVYDVELTTADGDVYTIIEPTKFELLKEVTY